MLSKKEREYLSGTLYPNKNYEYKLLHSIRKKIKTLSTDLSLLESKPEALRAVGAPLGKLTSYQTKLTPPKTISSTIIKYLN